MSNAAIAFDRDPPEEVGLLLREGRTHEAARLLGRNWEIESVVEHGDARGRTMGFPTANMHLTDGYPLAFGIYAVRVIILRDGKEDTRRDGVANFGIRPMYRITRPLLEAHLFDFDGDLYGLALRVEFVAFLRPEATFPSLDSLIQQIQLDARQARSVLAAAGNGITGSGATQASGLGKEKEAAAGFGLGIDVPKQAIKFKQG